MMMIAKPPNSFFSKDSIIEFVSSISVPQISSFDSPHVPDYQLFRTIAAIDFTPGSLSSHYYFSILSAKFGSSRPMSTLTSFE